nr:integrase, catalytic region, zinc finger, CCHC-type, peptidase aspartic, catalytic [Tanacetum cinerariifolium]
KNRIRRTHKKSKETELEDHPRKVKSSLNKESVVDSRATSSVIKSVSNVNSNLKCASCNGCLFSDNHDACVVEYINSVNASRKSKSVKNQLKGRFGKQQANCLKPLDTYGNPQDGLSPLKEQLNKLKGKAVLTEVVSLNRIDPELLKVDVAPLVPKLRKNRSAHTDYIRHTPEEAATIREIVESDRLLSPLNTSLDYAYNTKKNRIRRTQRKAKKNKIKDHLRTVKSSLNKKSVVDSKATSSVINSVLNVNSDLKYASCNGCLFSDNHDACVVAYINSMNVSIKSKSVKTLVKRKVWKPTGNVFKTIRHIWKPTGQTFTLVGNVCPLTMLATPTIVLPREPIPIVNTTDKPVLTLVYSRKTKAANKKVPNKMEPNNSWGSSSSNVPSPLIACRLSKSSSGTWTPIAQSILPKIALSSSILYRIKFRNDHVAKIMGYGDYQIGNASKTKSWLWHRRLSHLNIGAINHLARQGLVRGLLKLKFEKDHLCS